MTNKHDEFHDKTQDIMEKINPAFDEFVRHIVELIPSFEETSDNSDPDLMNGKSSAQDSILLMRVMSNISDTFNTTTMNIAAELENQTGQKVVPQMEGILSSNLEKAVQKARASLKPLEGEK